MPLSTPQVVILDPDDDRRAALHAQVVRVIDVVVREADNVTQAVEFAGQASRTVLLVAVHEPINLGIATVGRLRDAIPEIPAIACSERSDTRTVRSLIQSGARDLLPATPDDDQLRDALERQLTEDSGPAHAPGTVLTVIGAKGGVGKTTISTNLAAAIAHYTDRSVLLVDLDTRFGDLAVLLDLEPRYSVVDLALVGEDGLTPEVFKQALTPHDSGAWVLAAPQHPAAWSQVGPEQLQGILRYSRRLFDFVIFDTPGAYTDLVAAAIDEADFVLLASSLERTSIKDTRYVLDLLEAEDIPPERIHLILNQVHARVTFGLEETAALVKRPSFAEIPYDDRVIEANSEGTPVVLAFPSSDAARAFRRIAARLAPADAPALTPRRRLWRALVAPVARRFRRAA